MRTLQELLVILGSQKLGPGYLTPPKPTALETAIDLKRQLDAVTINGGSYQPQGNLLFAEAWVGSLSAGQDAIWLAGVDGRLDLSQGKQPAYVLTQDASAGGGGGATFNAGFASAGSVVGTFGGITAVKITTPRSGTLQSLSVFPNTAGANIKLGLYADSAGSPAALLASSAAGVAAIGLVTLAVTGGPTLPAGNYWAAVLSQNPFDAHMENTGGNGAFLGSQVWNGGVLPTPFPVGYTTGPFAFSLYATFLG